MSQSGDIQLNNMLSQVGEVVCSAACEPAQATKDGKVNIAVFDIDGTLIKGQSPAILTYNMFRRGVMPFGQALRAGLWGLKYKAGLTVETEGVRKRVFDTFSKMPSEEADEIIADVYNEKIVKRIRQTALEKIAWHKKRGDFVLLITATFEPMAQALAQEVGADAQSSTRMAIVDDSYTGEIIGRPAEGDEKIIRLVKYADEHFGPDGWVLDYSYADHKTDIPILSIAQHPVAVNPKRGLTLAAKKNGWEIQEW